MQKINGRKHREMDGGGGGGGERENGIKLLSVGRSLQPRHIMLHTYIVVHCTFPPYPLSQNYIDNFYLGNIT